MLKKENVFAFQQLSARGVALLGLMLAVLVAPHLKAQSVSVTSLAFGNQVVGITSAPQTILLRNNSTGVLYITGLSITGPNTADFAQTNSCMLASGTAGVAAGYSCEISVTITPRATGARTAQVNITSNGSNSPLEISLTGTGLAAGPPLSVTSLAFGSQGVGFTSAPQSVTVTNSSTSALNITSIAITGTNSADFAQTNTCGSSVAAGRSCVISVTFTPKATGTRTASINVTDNASGSPQTISLTGTGIAGYTTVSYPVGGFPAGWPTGTSSQPKGVVFDGTNIWVANSFTNNVTKLLASTGAIVGIYSMGTNYNLVGLAFDGTNIWVTNQGSNTVTKLLASTGAIVGVYPVGSEPEGIAFDGTNIWVANNGSAFVPPGNNDVTKLRASTGATVGTYGAAAYPVGVAFDGTNIWVTSKQQNTVTKLVASTVMGLGSFYVGTHPEGVVFDGVNIWVANNGSNTVTKLLASTGALVGTYPVGSNPQGIAFDGVNIWVANSGGSTVTQLLASTGALVSTYPVGSQPSGVIGPDSLDVANPGSVAFDGTNIWVTNFYSGTVTKISPASSANQPTATLSVTSLAFGNQVVGLTSAPQSVTVTNSGTSALSITGIAITGTNSADFAQTNTCGGSVGAGRSCVISVTFTPTATGTRTASISVTDNASSSPQAISLTGTGQAPGGVISIVTYTVGSNPQGIAFDGVNIWVANSGSSSVTKMLASTGATVGTYPVGLTPQGIAFDGVNIWVANNGGNTVTKLLASTGATVGTYPVGSNPQGIAFDGINIWVANSIGNTVTKLLASTGATVETVGGTGWGPWGIAFDGVNIWVANFHSNNVAKLLASTGTLVGYYPAGSNPGGIAFDGVNIWVANNGSSSVTKLLASTGALVGTYPVGSNPGGIAFDGVNIWVANSGSNSVTKLLASTGATVGTYPVGLMPQGIAVDGTNIWVTNWDSSTVTKISPTSQAPSISPGGIVPLDSTAGTIQPGEWVSIWGGNLASGTTTWSGNFPTSLGGTSVRINGKAAYLSFVSPGQINLQAPDDTATGTVPVVVTTADGSTTSTVTLGEFAPSFALLDSTHVAGIIPRSDGSGAYGGGTYDILGPTGSSLGYPTVAAKAGDSVELYGVGFGTTSPSVPAGQAFSGAAATTNSVQLAISGRTVLPSFAGLSEAGLFQINVTIPAGLGTGDLPLVGNVGGVQTQTGVVISVQ